MPRTELKDLAQELSQDEMEALTGGFRRRRRPRRRGRGRALLRRRLRSRMRFYAQRYAAHRRMAHLHARRAHAYLRAWRSTAAIYRRV
ncbi:MAG TPA: hypothetical protein DEA08_24940 [Planctomycetes bacterium]|nr:hypothetical protein [Planctomycetota bacterium]|tara:strand:- start:624 stop:887 length:264 start_codon:yes stop_codon:yes gene_type:complete